MFKSPGQEVAFMGCSIDVYKRQGQTKEDQKRDEIFYNETLAPDEVNRLLYPKVFTNSKRYSKDGVEEITEIKDNDNRILETLLYHSKQDSRYINAVSYTHLDVYKRQMII